MLHVRPQIPGFHFVKNCCWYALKGVANITTSVTFNIVFHSEKIFIAESFTEDRFEKFKKAPLAEKSEFNNYIWQQITKFKTLK